jgi:hypothetical protein
MMLRALPVFMTTEKSGGTTGHFIYTAVLSVIFLFQPKIIGNDVH